MLTWSARKTVCRSSWHTIWTYLVLRPNYVRIVITFKDGGYLFQMRLFTVIHKLLHLLWRRAFRHSILTAVIIIGLTVISMLNLKIGGQDDTRPTRTADRALRSKRLLREQGLPFTELLLIVRTFCLNDTLWSHRPSLGLLLPQLWRGRALIHECFSQKLWEQRHHEEGWFSPARE